MKRTRGKAEEEKKKRRNGEKQGSMEERKLRGKD